MDVYTSVDLVGNQAIDTTIIKKHHIKKGFLKRGMDLILMVIMIPTIVPIMLIIALMIKMDSRGKVFFTHTRIGKGGRKFKVLKFRTMVLDADKKLEQFLEKHPELKMEWKYNHKLRSDPRVTKVGRTLRRFSLDELPQFMNILKGEMSLIGPRPITDDEVAKYGDSFEFYKLVRPGLTGLWQVSGRNNTSYRRRVELDEYYVCNWSLKLDIKILIQTVKVVLMGEGAY